MLVMKRAMPNKRSSARPARTKAAASAGTTRNSRGFESEGAGYGPLMRSFSPYDL